MDNGVGGLGFDVVSTPKSKFSNRVTETVAEGEQSNYLDFDSYLKLLVTQMQNQDFNDPMKDSEFLNQMATYSMLEGIKSMTLQSTISHSTSLVGKAVTVRDEYGVYETGMADSVAVIEGKAYLMVNGKSYDANTVSDIVDPAKFRELQEFIGKTVEAQNPDNPAETLKGEVTSIAILAGQEFLVIDSKHIVERSIVTVIEEDPEEGGDEGEVESETSEVSQPNAMADFSENFSSISGNLNVVEAFDGIIRPEENETLENLGELVAESAMVSEVNYAAGIYSEGAQEIISDGGDEYTVDFGDFNIMDYLSSESQESWKSNLTQGDLAEETARVKAPEVSAYYYPQVDFKTINVKAGEAPLRTYADSDYYRKDGDAYPVEAALADAYKTRMFDIKHINNKAITSRIDTSKIIGYTTGGEAVTEIGFSGFGKLGEVVTFADGRQRVEIRLSTGRSSWHFTTGRYTLDQICNLSVAPGSLSDLSPSESAIRTHALKHITAKGLGGRY